MWLSVTASVVDSLRGTGDFGANAGPSSVATVGSCGKPSLYGVSDTLLTNLAPFLAGLGGEVIVYGLPRETTDSVKCWRRNIKTSVTKDIETHSLSILVFGATSILDAFKRTRDFALVVHIASDSLRQMPRWRGVASADNLDGIEWRTVKWSDLGEAVFNPGPQATINSAIARAQRSGVCCRPRRPT
jgi:hypothetical protein